MINIWLTVPSNKDDGTPIRVNTLLIGKLRQVPLEISINILWSTTSALLYLKLDTGVLPVWYFKGGTN